MFQTKHVEALLKSAPLSADDDKRKIRCVFEVRPFTEDLAREISADLAEILFHAERPVSGIRSLSWDQKIPKQWLRFVEHPRMESSGGRLRDVEIVNLQIVREKKLLAGKFQFRLLFEARFTVIDRAPAIKLFFDCLEHKIFLSFEPMQQEFAFDQKQETPVIDGAFINRRSQDRRYGSGAHLRGGGSGQMKGGTL